MKFQYKSYDGTLRPIIPIKVKNGNHVIGYEVLIDSGADLCIFDRQVGEILGLDIERGERGVVYGINDGAGREGEDYYMHSVTINIGGWDYSIKAAFKTLSAVSYGVVGQKGFFDLFVVKFNFMKAEIELKENMKR